jgi:diguanylate cyclase (GGDEF)-like protein
MPVVIAVVAVALTASLLVAAELGRRRALRKLAHDALHDHLTDLPNRGLLESRLATALARARRNGFTVGVLVMNIDRFQVVNHNLGHPAGDIVLRAVANRLRAFVRDEDTLARVGGDEFAILLEQATDDTVPARVAERILEGFATPIDTGEEPLAVSVSIGIAHSLDGFENPSDVIRDASMAMRRAKELGRSRYSIFDPGVGEQVRRRLSIETELARAIDGDELELWYQPQIQLSTGRVVAVEALVRWRHPQRGLLLPGEFIEVAEQTGLIDPLGRWVVRKAATTARRLSRPEFEHPPIRVAVNISPRELQRGEELARDVSTALDSVGIDPSLISVEITETLLVGDNEPATAAVRALRRLGVEIAIDDFGTGYSSLAYLSYLPASLVKLDRSFVAGLADHTGETIVRWIVDLTRSLGLQLCAEGVETEEQRTRLLELGCPQGQGFGICKPVPEDELEAAILRLWTPAHGVAPVRS